MMVRLALALTMVAFALSAAACSSLTRPDEIQIVAEPAPALRQLPNMPSGPGGAARPAPQPPSGGGCGE